MKRPHLEIENLRVAYNSCRVLDGIGLHIEEGERWAIIGKNGTGKSTLIKTIAALLRPVSGSVRICGRPVLSLRARERARYIAYVPQKPEAVIPYTVHDFVMLGRYSTMGPFGIPGETDRNKVAQALDFCDVRDLCNRMMTTLSGGELQRVMLAGALAQDTPILLLDEPTTFLDPAHERLFFRSLESAHEKRELTIVMVTHDINTALASCTHVLALLNGRVQYAGSAYDFKELCPDVLVTLYGIEFGCYFSESKLTRVYGTWVND